MRAGMAEDRAGGADFVLEPSYGEPDDLVTVDLIDAGVPPRSLLAGHRTVRRVLVGVLAVAFLVALAVQLRPTAKPAPTLAYAKTPLTAAACAEGRCSSTGPSEAQLWPVRVAVTSDYQVSGLRVVDDRQLVSELVFVASDGPRIMSIRAARTSPAPPGWVTAPTGLMTYAGDVTSVVIRTEMVRPADHSRWLVEIRALCPADDPTLISTARALSADPDVLD